MRFKGESPVELNYFDLKEVSVVLHVQRLYCKQWCYYVFVAFEYHRISCIWCVDPHVWPSIWLVSKPKVTYSFVPDLVFIQSNSIHLFYIYLHSPWKSTICVGKIYHFHRWNDVSEYRTLGEDTCGEGSEGVFLPPWLKEIEIISSHVGKYHLL